MNTSQNKIPIIEFAEVKFEPAVLASKTSLKATTWQRVPGCRWFGRSEFVRKARSFRPSPSRSLKNSAKFLVGESEMESKK